MSQCSLTYTVKYTSCGWDGGYTYRYGTSQLEHGKLSISESDCKKALETGVFVFIFDTTKIIRVPILVGGIHDIFIDGNGHHDSDGFCKYTRPTFKGKINIY